MSDTTQRINYSRPDRVRTTPGRVLRERGECVNLSVLAAQAAADQAAVAARQRVARLQTRG